MQIVLGSWVSDQLLTPDTRQRFITMVRRIFDPSQHCDDDAGVSGCSITIKLTGENLAAVQPFIPQPGVSISRCYLEGIYERREHGPLGEQVVLRVLTVGMTLPLAEAYFSERGGTSN